MTDDGKQGVSQRPGQDAGQDATIRERLERDPFDADAKLDEGSDESMDASDPPSSAIGGKEPPESSGFDPVKERANKQS